MRFPKLPDGPSPGGEGDVQALERFDTPYLSTVGPDYVATKAGAFRNVTVSSGAPYWYTKYISAGGAIYPTLLIPDTGVSSDLKTLKAPLGPGAFFSYALLFVYVGDSYVLFLVRDFSLPNFANWWPRLEKIGAPTPRYDVVDVALDKGKSIDYHSQILIQGLAWPSHFISMFAAGYHEVLEGFVWGVSHLKEDTPPAHVARTRQPYMWVGDTKTRTAHQVTLPQETGRDMLCFTPFAVGKGKLQYLHGVTEDLPYAQTYLGTAQTLIEPFLATSTDYGESWSRTVASFLTPVLSKYKADFFTPTFPGRPAYLDDQLEFMMRYSATFYVGNGKVMVFIPNGMKAGEDVAHDNPADRAYQPMMFVGDALSASLTRVAWPADNWAVNYNGFAQNVGDYQVGFRRMADLHSAHFSFGVGCLYVPIIPMTAAAQNADLGPHSTVHANPATGAKIMVTHDFGATWSIVSTAVPDAVQNVGLGCFAGSVIEPYKSADKKGVLLFTGYDAATSKFEVWRTNGAFDKWTRVWRRAGQKWPEWDTNGNPNFDSASNGVNYGGTLQHKSCVFPAFPGEFEKAET